jgi:hypothetical protein
MDADLAFVAGMVLGIMKKSGIPAYPVVDEEGNYTPRIRIRVDMGHAQPTDVELEVKA